ncbi:unnamed protein product, partial [Adineta ricciae]
MLQKKEYYRPIEHRSVLALKDFQVKILGFITSINFNSLSMSYGRYFPPTIKMINLYKLQATQYIIYQLQTQYMPDTSLYLTTIDTIMCGSQHPTTPTAFFPILNTIKVYDHAMWTKPATNSTLVNGFLTECTYLEALLVSTLDCLYDSQCIQTLTGYFPALSQ